MGNTIDTLNIKIHLNGEEKEFESNHLLTILESLDLSEASTGVAVAVQDRLVRKPDWATTLLESGDRVEVITAAQGG